MKRNVPSGARGPADNLGFKRRAGFAAGDLGFNLTWQTIELYLLFFYTEVVGLSPAWAGFIFVIGTIVDGAVDPFIAGIADRTRTRWGRFRPYLLFGGPFVGLSLMLVFYVPPVSAGALAAYALIAHLLLRTTYSFVNVPYTALMSRITHDARERARLAGLRMQCAALGGLAVTSTFLIASETLEQSEQPSSGYLIGALVLALLMQPFFLLAFRSSSEPAEAALRGPRPSIGTVSLAFLEDARAFGRIVVRNRALLRVIGAVLLSSAAVTMLSKSILYYFKYNLGNEEMGKIAIMLVPFAMLVSAPLWVALANRASKRNAWIAACVLLVAPLSLFYLLPLDSPLMAASVLGVALLGSAGLSVCFWATLPDTVEQNEWVTGSRDEAKVHAVVLFFRKVGQSINPVLFATVMTLTGFVANTEQSDATLAAIKGVMVGGPIVCAVGAILILWGYRLDHPAHERLRRNLAARR